MFCKSFNVKVSNNLWITYLIVYLTIVQIYIYWISWYHSRYCSRPSSSSWSISFRWTKETLWVHNCTGELGKLIVWTLFTLLFLMKISLAWYMCLKSWCLMTRCSRLSGYITRERVKYVWTFRSLQCIIVEACMHSFYLGALW